MRKRVERSVVLVGLLAACAPADDAARAAPTPSGKSAAPVSANSVPGDASTPVEAPAQNATVVTNTTPSVAAPQAPAADSGSSATPADVPTVDPKEIDRGRFQPRPGETCYELKVHQSTASVDDVPFAIPVGEQYEQFYYDVPWPADTVATMYGTIADNAAVLHHWLMFSTSEAQTHGAHHTAPFPTLFGTDPALLAGWAVGGPSFDMPEGVGMELPNPGRTLSVQWHFYNSTDAVAKDASSIQICTVPKSMRPNIGSITWAGTEDLNGTVWTGGPGMPPKQESTFTSTCSPGRTDTPIHIFAFEPHMHRIGRRMTSSIIRGGGNKELVFDQPFSFGSETHYLNEQVIMPGDALETSCTFYNDTDKGVPFGESTDSEMCFQFVFHYPAHALSNGRISTLGVTDTCW